MAKSSIHFKKAKEHSSKHNLRIDEPNYLLSKKYRLENEYWRHSETDKALFDKEANKKRKGGPKIKFENARWEAVLNLNAEHTMRDVKKVAKEIEKQFNITCCEISIHKDEGYVKNEEYVNKEVVYNYHAHINFITVKDGKQNWRRQHITQKKLQDLQCFVAESLNMERGEKGSKIGHFEHKAYKKMMKEIQKRDEKIQEVKNDHEDTKNARDILKKVINDKDEKIKQLENKLEDQRNKNKQLRADLQARSAKRQEYAELEQKNKDIVKTLTEEIKSLKMQNKQQLEQNSNQINDISWKIVEYLEEKLKTQVIHNRNPQKPKKWEFEYLNSFKPLFSNELKASIEKAEKSRIKNVGFSGR